MLLILVDDLNDWIGELGGHPQARTPNMDRLMHQGTNFTNAQTSVPVCLASRNSMLTGLNPATTGWYFNGKYESTAEQVLGPIKTLPEYFRSNGYYTMAGGKIFHNGVSDYRQELQWDETLPHYEIKDPQLLARGGGYGRDGSEDHKYYPFPEDGGQIIQFFGPDTPGKSLCWGALDRDDIPMGGVMPDEYIASWAAGKLAEELDRPFLLAVGFIRPHAPFTAPREFFDMFPIDEVIMPDIHPSEMADIPLYGKAMAYGIIPGGDHHAVEMVSETFWRELVRANLACIAFVDHQIGKVLDALDASAHVANTVIALCSDHGQNFGEHRNWRKFTLWEESCHVPMVVRRPNQQIGNRYQGPVSLLDLYPTLLDVCGLPSVATNEGISLVPMMDEPGEITDHFALTTWGYKNYSIRTAKWRYIRYRDGDEELYDHDVDPHEHDNLADLPVHAELLADFREKLPKDAAQPVGLKSWEEDYLEKQIDEWDAEGKIPDWLNY